MTKLERLIETTIRTRIARDAQIVAVRERTAGAQGYSGALVRYYDVTYDLNGATVQTTLVTKDAPLIERQTLHLLQHQTAYVPWNSTADLVTDAPAMVCMQYLDDQVEPSEERVHRAARTLAAIHAANLGRRNDVPWLPNADPAFIEHFIIDACWRRGWTSVRAEQRFVDGFANDHGPIKAGGDFVGTLDQFTQPLEAAAARFLKAMSTLWEEGTSLTVVHADFHNDHLHVHEDRPYVIDWGDAHIGPLYLDLPNYFNRAEALLYRDALAERGHDIPVQEFLTPYRAENPSVPTLTSTLCHALQLT